jgi:hypothetical protein
MSHTWTTTAILTGLLTLASATAWATGGIQPQPQPQPTPGRTDPRTPTPVSVALRATPPTEAKVAAPVTIDVTVSGAPLVAGATRIHPVYTFTATKREGAIEIVDRNVPPRSRTVPLTWRPKEQGRWALQVIVEWMDDSGRLVGPRTIALYDRNPFTVTK